MNDQQVHAPPAADRAKLVAIARIHANEIRGLHQRDASHLPSDTARLLHALDQALDQVLQQLDAAQTQETAKQPAAHNDGPSVAECAQNDRHWPPEGE